MANLNIDLYSTQSADITLDILRQMILQLRAEFDSHNHDGSNSRSLQELHVDTLIAGNVVIASNSLVMNGKTINPLIEGSGAQVRKITTDQTITTGTATAITFNDEIYDTDSFHSNTINPSRLTAPKGGTYLITGNISIDSTVTQWVVYINVNGVNRVSINPPASVAKLHFAAPVVITADQYIEIEVTQNSGIDKKIFAGANGETSIAITRISS